MRSGKRLATGRTTAGDASTTSTPAIHADMSPWETPAPQADTRRPEPPPQQDPPRSSETGAGPDWESKRKGADAAIVIRADSEQQLTNILLALSRAVESERSTSGTSGGVAGTEHTRPRANSANRRDIQDRQIRHWFVLTLRTDAFVTSQALNDSARQSGYGINSILTQPLWSC